MDERRNKSGMNESAKRQKRASEGRAQAAQRTSSRPTSRNAYISNKCRAHKVTHIIVGMDASLNKRISRHAHKVSVGGSPVYWMDVSYREPNFPREDNTSAARI